MTADQPDTRAMPNGAERPGEHWNARLIREGTDRVPAPRPVPSFADRLAADERDQLDARAATAEQERDDALDDLRTIRGERDALRDVLADRDRHHVELHTRLNATENDLRSANRAVLELTAEVGQWRATYGENALRDAQRIIAERNEARAELGAAQELIAVVDDLVGQLDRARARYATRQPANRWRHHPCGLVITLPDGDKPTGGWCQRCKNDLGTDSWVAVAADLGSPAPRAQESDLAPWIRRAIADPGSIAGRRRGPSWAPGEEGYAEEQESVPAWITRAVLRVLAKDGQPHCERCSRVIRVDEMYEPPLPGIGLWEHRAGFCPDEREADRLAAEARDYRWTPDTPEREVRGEHGPELDAAKLPTGATVQPELAGCPEPVWDGPYRMQCGKGAGVGVCATHGRFRAAREG